MKTWSKNKIGGGYSLFMGNTQTQVAVLYKCEGRRGYTVCISLPDTVDGYSNEDLCNLRLSDAKKAAELIVDQWFDRFKVL